MNTSIVCKDRSADLGCKVVLWDEFPHFNFYRGGRFGNRGNISFEDLSKQLKHLVYHHSVDFRARMTYATLVARGLSVHFIIDDDINQEDGVACIYQCMDLKEIGYSQKPWNPIGLGVEISYHPGGWENPNLYSIANQKKFGCQPHEIGTDTVHGQKFKTFKPTEAQLKACGHLAYGINKLFPEIKLEFPKNEDNQYIKTTVPGIENYRGLCSHFNLNRAKVDPLGFDFDYVLELAHSLKSSSECV